MTALSTVDVVVLAGGLGTRLRDTLNVGTPKILAPILDRPFLDLLCDWLAGYGARRLVLCLGHLAGAVQDHIRMSRSCQGMDLRTVIEPSPLGTGGALRFAMAEFTTNPVLVMNGDSWTDSDLGEFVDQHNRQDCYLSLLCVQVADASRYGAVEVDGNGLIARFREKESGSTPGLINAGMYLLSRQALDDLAASQAISFERDFLQRQPPGRIRAHIAPTSRFVDIGTPESLGQAGTIIVAGERMTP